MSKKKFRDSLRGKGYYIALILCAVAIGVAGFFYYRNAEDTPQQLQQPTEAVQGTVQQHLQTAAPTEKTPADTTPVKPPVTGSKPANTTLPVAGDTLSAYSMDALCYNPTTRDWRVHDGIDIAAEAGTAVCAAADGTVYTVYEDETMGMTVVISHDGGYTTRYASLATEVSVTAGQTVTMGQTIGTVGNTALLESAVGDHVHFSVSCNGEITDPEDFFS